MLIKSFSTRDMGDSTSKSAAGIYDCKRIIYVFVPKYEYDNKTFTHCKTAIINECAIDGDRDFINPFKISDSTVIRKAVYFGTIVTDIPGNVQSPNAFFTLDNVTTRARCVVRNGRTLSYAPNTFSSKMKSLDEETVLMMDTENEVRSIPPKYYSESDMFLDMGDWFDLYSEYDMKTNVKELVDNSTTIQFMDISKYDTMRLELTGSLVNIESKYSKSIEIPCMLGSAFTSYVGKGTTFIYDSDAFGYGKNGVNAKGGIVPLGKFYNKPWLSENINSTLEMFSLDCKDIEDMYGHIRVLYNPDSLGNKYKIRFKDYKVSPITPLGSLNNQGVADPTKDSAASGIDTGYSTDRTIQDSIHMVQEDNYTDFMKSMQGY